ncbi:L-histidine N(alpha)-methyltransferase [Alkalicaulis satelles]|uniref:L-histidine N(Alpha)-methyltransferase n=1 Tax=Alkalicaulis satelles TaxID=2609175 RepID=A0A5M6ZMT7_9PROT|nr:L-histidine N(alpha)-methyltransferase [Alkalicaulis satelles]KAA5803601.1 L-histidine N(alpha)-methyltransferase [Alkalicaulis satelles]
MTRPAASAPELAFFKDLRPPAGDFRADVLDGLSKPQKAIAPKYFYDAQGSRIFDAITRAPEYYITRTELALLDQTGPELRALAGPGAVVLEPGAGSSVKVRKLIDALDNPAAYVGMDISGEHVKAACADIASDHQDMVIGAVCHDFTRPIDLDALPLPPGRRIVFFPGSTIGNFELIDAKALLQTFRDWLRPGDALLIGVDLRKDAAILEAAYDDAGGATAAFNYNLVARINAELDGTIDPEGLAYKAFWNPYRSRVEMYLQALRDQSFTVAGRSFQLRAEETIHTENSHKFTPDIFRDLARSAGLAPKHVFLAPAEAFSIHWLERAREA